MSRRARLYVAMLSGACVVLVVVNAVMGKWPGAMLMAACAIVNYIIATTGDT